MKPLPTILLAAALLPVASAHGLVRVQTFDEDALTFGEDPRIFSSFQNGQAPWPELDGTIGVRRLGNPTGRHLERCDGYQDPTGLEWYPAQGHVELWWLVTANRHGTQH